MTTTPKSPTGRISVQGPNPQQLSLGDPLVDQLRSTFIRDQENRFVEVDYTDIERRILARMGEDNISRSGEYNGSLSGE